MNYDKNQLYPLLLATCELAHDEICMAYLKLSLRGHGELCQYPKWKLRWFLMPRIVEGRGWLLTRPMTGVPTILRLWSSNDSMAAAILLPFWETLSTLNFTEFLLLFYQRVILVTNKIILTSFCHTTNPRRLYLQLLRQLHACFLYLQVESVSFCIFTFSSLSSFLKDWFFCLSCLVFSLVIASQSRKS